MSDYKKARAKALLGLKLTKQEKSLFILKAPKEELEEFYKLARCR